MTSQILPSFTPSSLSAIGFSNGFAVLMAVYIRDDSQLLKIAVDSVFLNSLPPNQFVLVADGLLSDGLEKMINELQQQHFGCIDLIRLPINQGLAHALNVGLRYIHFPWVVRADADDLNLPHRFASLAELLKKQPSLELMSSAILEVDVNGQAIAVRAVPESAKDIRIFAKSRNPFNHMAVAFRRESVLACGGYPNVYLKEDYALWCRMLGSNMNVANSAEVLVHATAGRDMYRRRGGWRYATAEWALQKVMIESGLKSRSRGWLDGLARAAVFLAPAGLRGKIYEVLLRKPVSGKCR
ncbi:MAG: glycosyltransferase [Glaciimonas sp.]|nr:glycosyltransferase [Glaciimonas sp.]